MQTSGELVFPVVIEALRNTYLVQFQEKTKELSLEFSLLIESAMYADNEEVLADRLVLVMSHSAFIECDERLFLFIQGAGNFSVDLD